MHDWVTIAAQTRPEHPAVEAPDGILTYAELDAAADACARRLAALGVGAGARVATTLPPSTAFAALLHAAPRLGAALVPLNTRLPEAERRRQAALTRADIVVGTPVSGPEADIEPARELDAEAVHSVLFTSGTEAAAKPVELTVGNHDAAAAASAAALGVDPADRWLCPVPLFHVAGLALLIRSARAQTTVVLHDGFDAAAVAASLERGEATLVSLVPTMLRRVREAGLHRAPTLRAALLGGGPIPPDLLDWARAEGLSARCTYGMTETASQLVVTEPWEPAGVPLPGAEVACGEDGEILVRGAMVAPGALASDGWLHTGDRGHFDVAGRLHVDGRIKDVIVTGGENVAPAVVEAVLAAHPAVADAGVAGVPDPEWGEAVTAFVVERTPVADADLLAFCRERLGGHQVPKAIVRVAELPRNAAGKLLRRRLVP